MASEIISLNQRDMEDISSNKANVSITKTKGNPCIVKTPEQVSVKRERQVSIGQGEGETKWKGWA